MNRITYNFRWFFRKEKNSIKLSCAPNQNHFHECSDKVYIISLFYNKFEINLCIKQERSFKQNSLLIAHNACRLFSSKQKVKRLKILFDSIFTAASTG